MRKFFFLLLFLMLIFYALTYKEERLKYVQETFYANWWESEMLIATGYGVAPENEKIDRRTKALAKRTAVLDAYRNLATQAGSIRITREKKMLRSEVDALIKGAEVMSEDYDEHGNCTVVMRIPIYGVTNSVAKIAFKLVKKENFLKPAEDVTAEGNYTGLIIDCGDAELNPVLSPVIRNEDNQSIYSYNNLDYEKVISKGMIGYESKSENPILLSKAEAAKDTSRAGSNPLVIKAVNVGDGNTCPVISATDSDKILAENGVSHFLNEGAVVFTSNRIRGIRM